MFSGLVSLNVHEALTFDGTEICLHPDLFTAPPNNNNNHGVGGGGGASTTTTLAATPGDHHQLHYPAVTHAASNLTAKTTASAAASSVQQQHRPSHHAHHLSMTSLPNSIWNNASSSLRQQQPTTVSSSEERTAAAAPPTNGATTTSTTTTVQPAAATNATTTTTQPSGTTTTTTTSLLQVGDMIEIRVWDPRPDVTSAATAARGHHSRGGSPFFSHSNNAAKATTTMTSTRAAAVKRTSLPPPPLPVPPSSSSATSASAVEPSLLALMPRPQQQPQQQQQQQQPEGTTTANNRLSTQSRSNSKTEDESMQYSELSPSNNDDDHGSSVSASASVGGGGASASRRPTTTAADVGASSQQAALPTQQQQSSRPTKQHHHRKHHSGTDFFPPLSPRPSPGGASTHSGGSSTVVVEGGPPGKVITSGLLPPVFPRQQHNSNNAQQQATASSSSSVIKAVDVKSPYAPRGGLRTQTQTASSSSVALPAVAPLATTMKPPTRHVRDISDMTVDTAMFSPGDNNNSSSSRRVVLAAAAQTMPTITTTTTTTATTTGTTTTRTTATLALDGSHRLVDLQVPLGTPTTTQQQHQRASANLGATSTEDEDDEEDIWTQISATHTLRLSFVMLVTEPSLTRLKPSARTQVSLLRQVADLYHLSSYDMVTVHKIHHAAEKAKALQKVSADFILVTLKDQFLTRGDLHFFQKHLQGTWIYEGQRLHEPTRGVQAVAREVRARGSGQRARSGIVTSETLLTYRTRSARIYWLVQMSAEMWDYARPHARRHNQRGKGGGEDEESLCDIYFDKFIFFVYKLFAKWKEVDVSHSLTVVFFSRTFLGTGVSTTPANPAEPRDVYGRRYEDHCRIVMQNETRTDWNSLVVRLKEAFVRFPSEVGWNLARGEAAQRPSAASQGNVLETINATLNLLQYHYLDRDLHRVGNSIVVVSAGSGVFEVDQHLAGITYQRMMDLGIGSDMISLGLPPLHIAPFFLYVNENQGADSDGRDPSETSYEVPHWMHLSFVSYDSDTAVPTEKSAEDEKKDPSNDINSNRLDIGPNGFLRPRPAAEKDDIAGSTPLFRSTGFSSHGNAAASPTKQPKHNRVRQLIADRDIEDILEACRPRYAGAMPSPLISVLKMHASSGSQETTTLSRSEPDSGQQPTTDGMSLKEWGSLTFEENSDSSMIMRRRAMTHGTDAKDRSPLLRARSPPTIEGLERLDSTGGSSQASGSHASQLSANLLGMSYERPFLASQSSPSLSGIQMQRAPSLEMDGGDDDSQTALYEKSSLTTGMDADDDGELRNNDEMSRFNASVLKMMKAHDSIAAGSMSPKLAPAQDPDRSRHSVSERNVGRGMLGQGLPQSPRPGSKPTKQSAVLGALSRQPGSQPAPTGGIGAALLQHGGSTLDYLSGEDQEHANANPPISRNASTGRLSQAGSLLRIPEMFPPGLSPLILPPGALSVSNPAPDGVRRDAPAFVGRSFDRRMINTQDMSRRIPLGESPNSKRSSGVTLIGAASTIGSLRQEPRSETSPVKRRPTALSSSPPKSSSNLLRSNRKVDRSAQNRISSIVPPSSRPKNWKRKKPFNPFREKDEEDALAQKSHNRRRWSHVFPLGEVEFKRHSGPIWKSLCAPAILPLSIDYFPPQSELLHNYTFSIYNVALSEFERTNYSSNKYLLMEMVRQRLTLDYQLVPPSLTRNYRRERLGDAQIHPDGHQEENDESIRIFLSMGHRLQVLSHNPGSDTVEVTRYTDKTSQKNTDDKSFVYFYWSWCSETNEYVKVVQTFDKYSTQYNWNKVDRILCGDEDREMREGMRFKRIMFAIIPERFENDDSETVYVAKFKRLLEYFEKLRDKTESASPLGINIVSSSARDSSGHLLSTPGIAGNSMVRFYVQLGKGKRDLLEWMEIAVDSTFDTSWSWRIMFHWLVASAGKVDTQVQLLQRRCNQYGLNLVPFMEASVSKTVFLYPFGAPALFQIRYTTSASSLDRKLLDIDFIHDGVFYTDGRSIAQCIEYGSDFDFGKRWSKPPAGRQYVHRSGTLFARIIPDKKGWAIVAAFTNFRFTTRNAALEQKGRDAFSALTNAINGLNDSVPEGDHAS